MYPGSQEADTSGLHEKEEGLNGYLPPVLQRRELQLPVQRLHGET
jgi:hypothetical protein